MCGRVNGVRGNWRLSWPGIPGSVLRGGVCCVSYGACESCVCAAACGAKCAGGMEGWWWCVLDEAAVCCPVQRLSKPLESLHDFFSCADERGDHAAEWPVMKFPVGGGSITTVANSGIQCGTFPPTACMANGLMHVLHRSSVKPPTVWQDHPKGHQYACAAAHDEGTSEQALLLLCVTCAVGPPFFVGRNKVWSQEFSTG